MSHEALDRTRHLLPDLGRGSVAPRAIPTLLLLLAGPGCLGCSDEHQDAGVAAARQAMDAGTPEDVQLDIPWIMTSTMRSRRNAHTAVLLLDGKVLLAGGDAEAVLRTAEVYDPHTNTWALVPGLMTSGRRHPLAVRLESGEVLIGVALGQYPEAVDLYDPGLGTFTPAAPLEEQHRRGQATLLQDGKVLVTGGVDGFDHPSTRSEIYDPAQQRWRRAADMHVGRQMHVAIGLLDGRVLVVGGTSNVSARLSSECMADVEIYDAAQDIWTAAAPLQVPRCVHAATLLKNGSVLVTGGANRYLRSLGDAFASVEIYDPVRGTWEMGPPLSTARREHTATRLDNGAVLIVGGLDASLTMLPTAELFDPDAQESGAWVPIAEMGRSRLGHTATLLADGQQVLIAGGLLEATAEVYRPGALGQRCSIGKACASGLCVDGVCCDSACVGTCRFCALEGARGTCSPVPLGMDPRRECGSGAPCSAACGADGACMSMVGRSCFAGACSDDRLHRMEPASCEASRDACPVRSVSCGGFLCDPATGECAERCRSVEDCAPGFVCDQSSRCVPPPDIAHGDVGACSAGPPSRARERSLGAILLLASLALSARPRGRDPGARRWSRRRGGCA